jgi:hypothetical protein
MGSQEVSRLDLFLDLHKSILHDHQYSQKLSASSREKLHNFSFIDFVRVLLRYSWLVLDIISRSLALLLPPSLLGDIQEGDSRGMSSARSTSVNVIYLIYN